MRALRSARRRATRSRGVSLEVCGSEEFVGWDGGWDVNEGEEDWRDGVVEVKRVKVSEAGLRDIVDGSGWGSWG